MSFWLILLSWCWSSKPKTWPAQIWDSIYVNFVAKYDAFDALLYDTNIQEQIDLVWANTSDFTIWPVSIKLGDTASKIPQVVHNALIWQEAGKQIEIQVNPSDRNDVTYDPTNTVELSTAIFQKAGISLPVGSLQYIWEQVATVKEIRWEWEEQIVVMDTNPLKSYQTITYAVDILQVWGTKPTE